MNSVADSIFFVFKTSVKCFATIMVFYVPRDSNVRFSTVGFSRCGNVFLNRSLRLGREALFSKQNFHSAGFASLMVSRGVKVCAITREPIQTIVSNKVANPKISLTALYIGYIIFHLRILAIRKLTLISLEMLKNPDDGCAELLRNFLGEDPDWRLPDSQMIKKWIESDPTQDNNPLHISTPTLEKQEVAAHLFSSVERHPLTFVAQKLYNHVLLKRAGANA